MFITIALITILLSLWLYTRIRAMSILSRNGIPGPMPNLIWGNLYTHLAQPNMPQYDSYFSKYGPIMGYYFGKKPMILVKDLELARLIQIKSFQNFSDRERPILRGGLHPNPKYWHNIVTNQGPRWKETRTILNPTFSAAKLKTMTPIMESSIDIMIKKVAEHAQKGDDFDIYLDFQLLTTDVIAKCALGIDTDVQNNPEDEFFLAAQRQFSVKPSKFFLLFMCFPELDTVLYPVRRLLTILREALGWSDEQTLAKLVHTAINLRNNVSSGQKKKKSDLLQLMLDAKASDEEIRTTDADKLTIDLVNEAKEVGPSNGSSNGHSNGSSNGPSSSQKALSINEVVSNSVIFYEAGFETTSTTLGFIAWILIKYPEIQEKIRQEILEQFGPDSGDKFDYANLNKLTYMQMVINETMRYYPPVTAFVTRAANEDFRYKNITIPANTTVRIPALQIHHTEEYWPNHEKFDPERFRDPKSIDPVKFQPFGTGPRNCIGMRFALYEIKLTVAKLLSKYRLERGPSTEEELTVDYKGITETPKNGVKVRAVPL